MAEKKTADSAKIGTVPQFTKNNILGFTQYRARRDLLQVLLAEDRLYTIDEVDAEITQFMKGRVR